MGNSKTMNVSPNFLGFDSAGDFLESFFRFTQWAINGVAAIGATVTTFITGYMWDSHEAVWTLWLLMGTDWLTGVLKSMRNGEYVSNRLFRMPIYFVVTSFLISISWWMAKSNVVFLPIPAIAMGGFYAIYFSSLLENLGELELLPKKMVVILRKVGMKVIIKKYLGDGDIADELKDGR